MTADIAQEFGRKRAEFRTATAKRLSGLADGLKTHGAELLRGAFDAHRERGKSLCKELWDKLITPILRGGAVATFKDNTGREWAIVIPSLAAAEKAKAEVGLDMNKLAHDVPTLITFIFEQADLAVSAAWHFCAGQHPDVQTREQFLEVIDAAALDSIREAVAVAALELYHYGRAAKATEFVREILGKKITA